MLDRLGKPRSINVEVASQLTTKGATFYLYYPEDFTLGISSLPNALTKAQVEATAADLMTQSARLNIALIHNYVDQKAIRSMNGPNEPYLFITSERGKATFELQASKFKKAQAELVLLDKERQPVLFASLDLLVPAQ